MQFRLPRLHDRYAGGEAPDPIPDEFAGLVREAFPLPAASEALRERVARRTAQALAVPPVGRGSAHPHTHTPTHPRSRMRLALAGTLVALLLLPLCSTRPGGVGLAFASAPPTPGQLAILDGAGQPLGLCPLKHTDVDARISGYVARVTVKQEFQNPSRTPVEAIYTFPLPEDAAVDDMTMTLGSDRIVKGEIKRRQEAREIYEAARDAGQAAALLDQERPNIFTQSVANIMPGEKVTIAISYVNTLKYEAGTYEFAFPMVVGPRYTGDSGGYQAPGLRGEPSPIRQFQGDPGTQTVVTYADKITPPITPPGTRAGHDISVQVSLDAGLPLQAIHSELHPVDVQREGETRAMVRLRGQRALPNKDFILQYGVAGAGLQTGVLAQADDHGGGHFTLVVQPPVTPASEEPRAKEIVFVIDQSGSQSGWPIRKAKETMGYLIRNMNPGDTFQLLGFNTEINACFERPVSNNPGNVARALRFLDPIEGDGGTDILNAVDYALRIPPDRNRRRIICYLTDGYVGDDMQILDYVRKHRGEAHMFPFGIGDAPNRFLLSGMAKEGHGTAEFVTLNSSAEAAAARFYRRISKPILTEVGVDWNGLPIEEVYPSHIPDLFVSGRPILLNGRFTAPAQGEIILHGSLGGRPWRQAVPVSFGPASDDGEALAALWAREKIEDLQGRDWLGQQTGNPNPNIVEKIVDVALKYRLMSQHTSFVAVEQRVVNLLGKPQVVDIPVELPEGMVYDGIFGGRPQAPQQLRTDAEGVPNVVLADPEPAPNVPQSRANPFVLREERLDALSVAPPAINSPIPQDDGDDAPADDNLIVAGEEAARSHMGDATLNGRAYTYDGNVQNGPPVSFGRNSVTNGNVNLRFKARQPQAQNGFMGYSQNGANSQASNTLSMPINDLRLKESTQDVGRPEPMRDGAVHYNLQPKPEARASQGQAQFFAPTTPQAQMPSLLPQFGARQQQQQGQQAQPSWYYPPNSGGQAAQSPRGKERHSALKWTRQSVPIPAPPVLDVTVKHRIKAGEFSLPTEEGRRNGDVYSQTEADALNNMGGQQGGPRQIVDFGSIHHGKKDGPARVESSQVAAPARPALGKLAPNLQQAVLGAKRSLRDAKGQISGRWEGDRRVAVQLWIGPLPDGGLQQLREAGFEAVTVLRPNLVFLGTVRVADLEKLAALPFVLYLDPPKVR